jgi:hypothetical protein
MNVNFHPDENLFASGRKKNYIGMEIYVHADVILTTYKCLFIRLSRNGYLRLVSSI